MPSKEDVELTSLLTKLYTLQEDVGAKEKTTDEEKQKAAASVSMGKGRAAKKTGSRFLELKSSIVERLQTIHKMAEAESDRVSGKTRVAKGNNPKEIIAAQSKLRDEIRLVAQDWEELDRIYKGEARKRKSRFSQEELEVQSTMVTKLKSEIDKVKEAQMKGFSRGGAADVATVLNTKALAELAATPLSSNDVETGGGGGWATGGGGGGAPLNDDQRMQVQKLKERDQEFDEQLDRIGDGITTLGEIASMQKEEVDRQNVMLDQLGNRIDGVQVRT